MATAQRIIQNLYRDSVSLMKFSERLRALDGIKQASAVMATENNISLLVEAGLLAQVVSPIPNDLLIVVEGKDELSVSAALAAAEAMLKQKSAESREGGVRHVPPRSIEMGLEIMPSTNLVLISTPGEYAAAEARKALQLGLHVMLFSDNVSMEEEIPLKQYAREHDLLVMGPDCGTAIINGVPLGFANVVCRGDIGVVAASGTGLQQVTCLIDRLGSGITQAIGTGGHDLKSEVGGITMLQGIEALVSDPKTKVLLLVSKPPSPDVMQKVLEKAEQSSKPVVVVFIGADPASVTRGKVVGVKTLEDAAVAAEQPSRRQVLRPVDEAVRHHVERHVHLLLADPRLRVVVDERQQRAEGQRVHQHVHVATLADALAHGIERGRALVGVGGVDVEEDGVLAGRAHVLLHLQRVRQGRAEVEVHAEDAVAGLRQFDRSRAAEAARRAEHERPFR